MASKNLQNLIDRIYQEGVERAKKEGEQTLDEFRQEAQEIIKRAEEQAERIVERAEQKANEIRKNNESEMRLAARQAMSALKQRIVDLVISEAVSEPLKKAFKDQKFIQNIVEKMIFHWINDESRNDDPRVMLPGQDFEDLHQYFASREAELLKKGVHIEFKGTMKDGFAIGPQDGSYKISFTSEDFENYFKTFMRPRSFELLFGSGE